MSQGSQAGGSADSKRKLYLGYERDEISKLFGVFAWLEVEDVQAGFVMTPLQSKVVSVAFRISLDASLTGVPRSDHQEHRGCTKAASVEAYT